MDILRSQNLIPQPDVYAPSFYFACGQVYDILYDWERSYELYQTILTKHPQHAVAPDAERALLDNPAARMQHSALQNTIIAACPDFMPALSHRCGWMYAELKDWENAFRMHEYVLKNYPNHSLASSAAHALLDNPVACERHGLLRNTTLAGRPDFMPTLSHRCGQMYERKKDWVNAIRMYEYVLNNYPNHALALDAEAALA